MKYELKKNNSNLTFDDLESGDMFVANDGGEKFLAMKIVCADGNEYIVDFEDDNAYSDVDNYEIVRMVYGKFIEMSETDEY